LNPTQREELIRALREFEIEEFVTRVNMFCGDSGQGNAEKEKQNMVNELQAIVSGKWKYSFEDDKLRDLVTLQNGGCKFTATKIIEPYSFKINPMDDTLATTACESLRLYKGREIEFLVLSEFARFRIVNHLNFPDKDSIKFDKLLKIFENLEKRHAT
jgi:hypothetical protein